MKTRKEIIKDIDRIWQKQIERAANDKGKYKISLSSRIASYILRNFANCECQPCGCNEFGEIYCDKHYL